MRSRSDPSRDDAVPGATLPLEGGAERALRLYRWTEPAVLGVGLFALSTGFGQFGAVASLGDVARTFGHLSHGATFADQVGLSGTLLGIGLAVIRLASIGGLPLASLADRWGRRRMLIATAAVGLALTVAASVSPSYWWFVGVFAVGRPFLSANLGIAQVGAVELTAAAQRTRAVAMVSAGYAVGAGLTAIVHSLGKSALGFRGVFALAVVPLVFLPLIARMTVEPDRFARVTVTAQAKPVLGPVGPRYRGRLATVCLLAFAISVVTGPANSLVFIYAQNYLHLSGVVTSGMVVAAGAAGLCGLLGGRWLADRWGRRPTVAMAMVGMAVCGTIAYTGTSWALVGGYVAGVTAGAVFAPAGGALANELFPTEVRASVAGWYIAAGVLGAVTGLLAFGAVASAGRSTNNAAGAAAAVFLPMILAVGLLLLLPETRGHEPEELWASAEATVAGGPAERRPLPPGDGPRPADGATGRTGASPPTSRPAAGPPEGPAGW